jgi:hypothetical protein
MESVELFSKSGIFLGVGGIKLWDSHAHDMVIKKLTRGLYFHIFQSIIPLETSIKAYWLRSIPEQVIASMSVMRKGSVAENRIKYAYFMNTDAMYGLWLYSFYDAHLAGAFVGTHGDVPAIEPQPTLF